MRITKTIFSISRFEFKMNFIWKKSSMSWKSITEIQFSIFALEYIAQIKLLQTKVVSCVQIATYIENFHSFFPFSNSESNHCECSILKSLWRLFQTNLYLFVTFHHSWQFGSDFADINILTWMKKNCTTRIEKKVPYKKSDIRFGCDLVFNSIIKTNSFRCEVKCKRVEKKESVSLLFDRFLLYCFIDLSSLSHVDVYFNETHKRR